MLICCPWLRSWFLENHRGVCQALARSWEEGSSACAATVSALGPTAKSHGSRDRGGGRGAQGMLAVAWQGKGLDRGTERSCSCSGSGGASTLPDGDSGGSGKGPYSQADPPACTLHPTHCAELIPCTMLCPAGPQVPRGQQDVSYMFIQAGLGLSHHRMPPALAVGHTGLRTAVSRKRTLISALSRQSEVTFPYPPWRGFDFHIIKVHEQSQAPLANSCQLCYDLGIGCIPAALTAMGLSPQLISPPQLPGMSYPSCCLWRGINHGEGAMHWEEGNKMAFHAIILCNKTPEARKMINNVSCVSQLLPKIKRSSAPSAAPARVQVRALPQTPEPRSRRGTRCRSSGHGPWGPRESAECSRGGRERARSSGRCPRGARHPRRQQRSCPRARHAARLGHLRLVSPTAPANAGGSGRDFPALSRARCWQEPGPGQEALRAPGSSLLMPSPRWLGMSKLLLVNLTSRALFQ